MMCLAKEFAVVCLDAIDDINEKKSFIHSLKLTGKDIIEISEEQNIDLQAICFRLWEENPIL